MLKKIDNNDEIFKNEEFIKDKYKFSVLFQNLSSNTLELYSDGKNYVICRGSKIYPTWIWSKDNLDLDLLEEIKEGIELFRLDKETRFTCKRELYDLLKKDNYESLGDYYFEMGYLTCDKTIEPKKCEGHIEAATEKDLDVLTTFIYNESREISDVRTLTHEEAKKECLSRINTSNYYILKDDNNKIVSQAFYKIIEGNAKISGVYTPIEERGKAYAANLIYYLTNKALEDGFHVSLYTDYNYIPSNKSYKNVGYKDEDVLINFSCKKIEKDISSEKVLSK